MCALVTRRAIAVAAPAILAFAAACSHSGSDHHRRTLPASAPPPPSAVQLTPREGALTIAWNAEPSATSYNVYLAASHAISKANWRTLDEGARLKGAESPFDFVGLKDGVQYAVVVTSVNADGEGDESSLAAAAPQLGAGRPVLDYSGGRIGARGVIVSADDRALWTASEVSIEPNLGRHPLPVYLRTAAPPVEVRLQEPLASNAGFRIRIGYDDERVIDESRLFAVQWNQREQEWEPTTLVALDEQADVATVETRTSSIVQLVEALDPAPPVHGLPFVPAVDGWAIANFGHYYQRGGNALGMAAYAAWHFDNEAAPLAGAYPTAGSPSIAELLATRSQLAQSQTRLSLEFQTRTLGAERVGRLLKTLLSAFDEPLVLVMEGGGSTHAAVVFGYDQAGFDLYDVDFPGATQRLGFDGTGFSAYRGCRDFGFLAAPSLGRSKDLADLADEAREGFHSSYELVIGSPAEGELITSHEARLQGSLGVPLSGNTMVMAVAMGVPQLVGVNAGTFGDKIPVASGKNTLLLLANVTASHQSLWFKDAALMIRNFEGALPRTELSATLTWDQDGTDVDLYCIDPTGEAAWYGNRATASGVTLDFDDHDGYGPEHVTLTAGQGGGQVLPGGYWLRVHYFSDDYTGQPATGMVTIVIKEGTPHEYVMQLPFRIDFSDETTAGPDGLGRAWFDLARVDLVDSTVGIP